MKKANIVGLNDGCSRMVSASPTAHETRAAQTRASQQGQPRSVGCPSKGRRPLGEDAKRLRGKHFSRLQT